MGFCSETVPLAGSGQTPAGAACSFHEQVTRPPCGVAGLTDSLLH